jgi:hypothetical protein
MEEIHARIHSTIAIFKETAIMEEQIDIQEITPRSIILELREFLLTWDGSADFFINGTAKLGGALHNQAQSLDDDQISLNEKINTIPKKPRNTMKQAISQSLNQIKKNARNLDPVEDAEAVIALIKKYMKEALAKIEKVGGPQMFDAYQSLCNVDVIYDILTSELHRLDPVIGDLGCQWRAPFVIDLHDAVHDHLRTSFGDDFDDTFENAIEQYVTARTQYNIPHSTDILQLCERSDSVQPSKKEKPVFTSKKMVPLHDSIMVFCSNLEYDAPVFFRVLCEIETFLTETWLADELPRPGWDPLDYIRLCKLVTANRLRTLDEFGLSGIQYDFSVPDEKRTLGPCLEKISTYSMAYMTYVTEESCTLSNLIINEDGYAVDEEDENRIHIVGSAHKLMKDARFWTHQKSGFYKTNVCYGPTRAIFTRQAQKDQPIIIDLRRLICTPTDDGEDFTYTYNGGAILYYEPDDNGRFTYVDGDALTEDQKAKAGLVCEACSMVLVGGTYPAEDDPDYIFVTQDFQAYKNAIINNCDIVDLIMYGLSSHPELTTQICGSDNAGDMLEIEEVDEQVLGHYLEATGRDEMPEVETGQWSLITNNIAFPDGTKPEHDLLLEKARFLSILPKFNATSSQYKAPVRGNRDQADRNAQTMPFAPIHIYGSTYNRKIAELIEAEEHVENVSFDEEVVLDPDTNEEVTIHRGHRRIKKQQCRKRHNQ